MSLKIKICGLTTVTALDAALGAGADLIGLNFHPKSPRFVPPADAAGLAEFMRGRARSVALVVDPDDDVLRDLIRIVRPDAIQLHGAETPERVVSIARQTGLPVIKAVGVATENDLAGILPMAHAGAELLIDAKPPKDAAYPGGHGRPFDWSLLTALPGDLPFLLSGGLTPETVAEAIKTVRGFGLTLAGVDVSSGVERTKGVKDDGLISAFVAAARAAG